MSKYAIIINGIVDTTCIWNEQDKWDPPPNSVLIKLDDGSYVGPGDFYEDGKFYRELV